MPHMHWPCDRGLAASAADWLSATELQTSATLWALVAGEGLWLFLATKYC